MRKKRFGRQKEQRSQRVFLGETGKSASYENNDEKKSFLKEISIVGTKIL